ncbi:MAG: sialidase family protein, partial [Bryobacteraceae bacterium]
MRIPDLNVRHAVIAFFCVALCGFALAAGIEHITVYRDPTHYVITPWLLRLKNGEMIVTMRQAHARRREQRSHTDPTARGVLIRSRDNGRTWTPPSVIDDETYRFSQTEDVPVTQLSDGTLLVNLYSWALSPQPYGFQPFLRADGTEPLPFNATLEGLSTVRSTDNGHTWSRREKVHVPGLGALAARCPAIELPDGTLLLSVGTRKFGPGLPYSGYVITSKDKGKTWGNPVFVAEDPERKLHFVEAGIVRLKSGKIILMHRTESYLYQSESMDDGKTWKPPFKTPMWGYPAHLLELKDGRILCTYGHRRPPYGVRACISRDGGKTWDIDKEMVLRADGGTSDLGYPSVVELPEGGVFSVYWFNNEKAGDAKSE